MKKTVIVNIYNFIRMSHVEPSTFISDDFETVQKQMTLVRQYGFPATYALKHDALMEPRYQELLKTYTGNGDEISAWWEITQPLCRRAGVAFKGAWTEEYDDRVNSAYCIGYSPAERKRLVDAYMADFLEVFGFYPKTIGSWVLDTTTVSYAAEKYGVLGSAICRDQMGTDGFTLWGGFPNGVYFPSRKNENVPGSTQAGQLNVPMFRLLGPDPIYNFEQDVRGGLQGVYTLEPSWLIGRNPEWISWFFDCLTKEDSLGVGYAHVGQENNFLWENIQPGMEPQLKKLQQLQQEGSVRIETMADSADWFRRTYRLTPPMTFQASGDWNRENNLSAQWYACSSYRIGFLGEKGRLRIRDLFLYRQEYPSRYLDRPMDNIKSNFDALPLLFPQIWISREKGGSQVSGPVKDRPFIRLLDENGAEPQGTVSYDAPDDVTARAILQDRETERTLAVFTMKPGQVLLEGEFRLCFDTLPVFRSCSQGEILLKHEGFSYSFQILQGSVSRAGQDGLVIAPRQGRISLKLGDLLERKDIFMAEKEEALSGTAEVKSKGDTDAETGSPTVQTIPVPPLPPQMEPGSCIFPSGSQGVVRLHAQEPGEIRYTLDGTDPREDSPLYTEPLKLCRDTEIRAKLFPASGLCSETQAGEYRFGLQGVTLTSSTRFDPRLVFHGKGITDLLEPQRGSLDYLDGRWRGTLQDLEVCGQLPEVTPVGTITIGFLSHHRSGIIFPESLQLYTGPDPDHLTLTAETAIPCRPCAREIARQDFSLPVHRPIGCFVLKAHRYERMPQWCCYRGAKSVFTMADNIIVSPDDHTPAGI